MKLIIALLVVVCAATLASAQQIVAGGPVEWTPYTYGQAKVHQHPTQITVTAFYCGTGLIHDPANDPGNWFLGNTICIITYADEWLYYNWSPVYDQGATAKQSVLSYQFPNGLVTITYDPYCKMVTSVVPNGWLP